MEPKNTSPLISCICITYNRPEFLFRSILSFGKQTYTNKELVISFLEDDQKTKNIIKYTEENTTIKIQQIIRPKSDSIGKARNNAIASSNGKYICMWDDDDIYYPTRLSDQYQAIINTENAESSILTKILFYEATAKKAFLSFPSYWICTLLCEKDHLLNHPCIDSDEYELGPIMEFLISKKNISFIQNSPSLYTCIYHGDNVMKYTTFLFLINQSAPLEDEISHDIASFIVSESKIYRDNLHMA